MLALSVAASVWTGPADASVSAGANQLGTRLPQAIAATPVMSPFNIKEIPTSLAAAINARRGIDGLLETVSPFRFGGGTEDRAHAIDCLAAAAWYEAGDDADGQRAVVQVVLNRTRHPAYPKSVCGVVFQGSQRRTGCQFTFTCDGSLHRRPSTAAWTRALGVAQAALAGAVDRRVGTATHYHADYVLPYWAASLRKVSQIGAHIFYRWPGTWGSRRVLEETAGGGEPSMALLIRRSALPASGAPIPSVPVPASAGAPAQEPTTALALALPTPATAKPSSTIMTVADRQVGAGRWAVDAVNRCAGRAACLVLAYRDDEELARNRTAEAAARETPLFLFVRDAGSGMTVALWDCEQVPRPSAGQCLPQSGPALTRLLRDRG